jgi:hypothetical protein
VSLTGIAELKESYRKLGSKKFWLLMIATFSWIGSGVALETKLDFPDAYGFTCSGKGCLLIEVWRSPVLLHHSSWYEFALFALIWTMPALHADALIYAAVRKLRGQKYSIYADDEVSTP